MISKKTSTQFHIELKPSKQLQHLNFVIHLVACFACFANALPLAIKLSIASLIAASLWVSLIRLKTEKRFISYSEKQGWQIADNDIFENIQILKSTVITTFIIFLHIANKPAILIANDSLSKEDYRRLIITLKITVDHKTDKH